MAPAGNKLHEVAPGDVPEPTAGLRSLLSYNPDTELREEVGALLLNLLGASGGDWLKLSADLKSLEVAATAPIVTSSLVADPGRMFMGDGMNVVDVAAVGIVIENAPPTPTDGWDGLVWVDWTSKLAYGPRGKITVGVWEAGYDLFQAQAAAYTPPTEFFSAEVAVDVIPISPTPPIILQAKDIEQAGGFTQDASGITVPVSGSYRIIYNFQVLNNSGFEAVATGNLLINGSLPAVNGRQWGTRDETSRWPIITIILRTQLSAGDVIAVDAQAAGYALDLNGTAGGILIEKVID